MIARLEAECILGAVTKRAKSIELTGEPIYRLVNTLRTFDTPAVARHTQTDEMHRMTERQIDTSWLGLAGTVCAVTGAAGGIGTEIARGPGRCRRVGRVA